VIERMDGAPLHDEVVELAQELIRIDTSNPPGNETPAAELIAAHLREAGVDCELVGPDPERLNVVARVPGAGTGPSIMLLAHTDVVPAPSNGWTVPPFAATLADGRLIGRGAVDMKNELAARVVAVAALSRSGARPAGDVVLIAEADEERNVSDVGLSWLARERPDLRCDLAINEGGGLLLELASGRRVLTVSVGEKQVTSLRIRVFGRPGHASIPPRDDNAVHHAATAVDRLLDHTEPATLVPSVAAALEAIGAPAGEPEDMIAWASGQHPVLGEELPAVTRMTVTPTGLRTHEPPNVVPPFADVICDCRTLPGQNVDEIRDYVGRVLGADFRYELELLEPLAGGTESPTDTPLFEALREYAASRANAELLPLLSAGFTDSHWIREAWGTVAYGFAPVLFGDLDAYLNAAHANDEAIEIADLVEMAEFHYELIRPDSD
jgi:acetylornithine deacetylase/succinyl-diaminopimelate desuccinylase-like protein